MWTALSPAAAEDPDARCDRLLAAYELDIERLQAAQPVPFWDGFCGLVKVQVSTAAAAVLAMPRAPGASLRR